MRDFNVSTLRRRLHFLVSKMEKDDSISSKKFNVMEVEALQEAIKAMEREDNSAAAIGMLARLLRAIDSCESGELSECLDQATAMVVGHRA
jgi:tartrate dehydratase alpha subunit/fumarate hydratase class I-like protein